MMLQNTQWIDDTSLIVSFAGMNSPMSSSHPGNSGGGGGVGGGGGSTTFSSSSLNALQAISEGVGNPMPSPLTSPPPHKPDSSPSINSTNQAAGGPCKLPAYPDSKSPGTALGGGGEQQSQQHPHTPTSEGPPDKPDSQGPGDASRRVSDTKCNKKLLQLLTCPTDELVPPNHTPGSGPSSMPDSKDAMAVTSPSSSMGVSSSTGGTHGAVSSSGVPGHATSQSLQEKHKILHKLLQNGNTPDEVARITAEATGKYNLDSGAPELGPAAPGAATGSESKQEQHSSKKPDKPHVLLHYLLNKDDSKPPGDIKPKLEELEGRGAQSTGVSSSDPPCLDGKVKLETSDEVRQKLYMFIKRLSLLFFLSNPTFVSMVQAETLETILGVQRTNSGFYPEPDSRAGKEVGAKPGNIPDILHGKSMRMDPSKSPGAAAFGGGGGG